MEVSDCISGAEPSWAKLFTCNSKADVDDVEQQQNDQNYKQQADNPTGSIAPSPGVRPGRQPPNEENNQDDQNQQTHGKPPAVKPRLVIARRRALTVR